MRRVTKLLYDPPDYKVAETLKSKIVYLDSVNNLSVITLWSMFLGAHQDLFYNVSDRAVSDFHLWLNSEI